MQVLCARHLHKVLGQRNQALHKGASAWDTAAWWLQRRCTHRLGLWPWHFTCRTAGGKGTEEEKECWAAVRNLHILQLLLSHLWHSENSLSLACKRLTQPGINSAQLKTMWKHIIRQKEYTNEEKNPILITVVPETQRNKVGNAHF